MKSIWEDGSYLTEIGQKLGMSSDKVLQYINKGVLELTTSGKINMHNARKRIDKYQQDKIEDQETAQANVALFNLYSKTASAILNTDTHYDFEKDGKIQGVRQLIVKGANQFQVISALIKQQGLTYTESLNFYKDAMKSFSMTKGIDQAYEVAKIYARFEMLFQQAKDDYQSTLVIQREFINFFGIKAPAPYEAPKTRTEIEEEGGIVRPLVYVPDNGRDPDFVDIDGEEPNEDE